MIDHKLEKRITNLERKVSVYEKWATHAILIVIISSVLFFAITSIFKQDDGLYMVYACNTDSDRCYTLRANVTYEEDGVYVGELFFNEGGSLELDCVIGDFCYEISDSGDRWQISTIERLGETRD